MFRKLTTRMPNLLDLALNVLHREKILLDYAPPVIERGLTSQIIRVKCDDQTLNNLIRSKFKKQILITK
jgi:hypothetical protein